MTTSEGVTRQGLSRRALLRAGGLGAGATAAGLALPGVATAGTGEIPVRRGYAPVNGLQLYYEVHGRNTTGTPLLLVHGSFMSTDQWGPILPALARQRQVIVYDQQSHGRTADIDRDGRLRIGTGATLVRHSDPDSEVSETHAKAAGLLGALQANGTTLLGGHPEVRSALERRNSDIAAFWLSWGSAKVCLSQALAARRVLVIDAEDSFTSMLDHQLRSLGLSVTVSRFTEPRDFDDYDLVVMGPGPGDPCDRTHPKIAHLYAAVRTLLDERRPFLAVCLSHQVLCAILGFDLVRCRVPNQGLQREIDLFGARERVGFYNSFTARSDSDKVEVPETGLVEVSRDIETGEVHALRGPHFASVQFHAESLLTSNGNDIISALLKDALGA